MIWVHFNWNQGRAIDPSQIRLEINGDWEFTKNFLEIGRAENPTRFFVEIKAEQRILGEIQRTKFSFVDFFHRDI